MNLYDEAIEQVRKLWNGNELTYPKHTIKALERAKKQEKLLKLYQRLYNESDDMTILEFQDVVKQIKELESENERT